MTETNRAEWLFSQCTVRYSLMKKQKIETYQLPIGSELIPVTLHWRRRRTISVSIGTDGQVKAFAPKRARRCDVESFLHSKADWITRKLAELSSCVPLPTPSSYTAGGEVMYLGRVYHIEVRRAMRRHAFLRGKKLVVCIMPSDAPTSVHTIVDRWLRDRAETVFSHHLRVCRVKGPAHGIPEASLTIRKMKRSWGSCRSCGRITLNLELIKTPMSCIEYVIMHELCHRLIPNHGAGFYALLERCMPDWRERRSELQTFLICP